MRKRQDIDMLLEGAASRFAPTDGQVEEALREVTQGSPRARQEERLVEMSTSRYGRGERSKKRWATMALVAAASFAAGGLAVAQTSTGTTEEDVARQHGLESHPLAPGAVGEVTADGFVMDGTRISDCSPQDPGKALVLQEMGDHFYCIVADTEVDAWVIGQKLLGNSPTNEEIAEMAENLKDD